MVEVVLEVKGTTKERTRGQLVTLDSTLGHINNLNADEIVKDLLRSWSHIRNTYPQQIRRFQFKEQDKKELGQLAQSLYQKYNNPKSSAQNKVVWDEGIFKQFFS